MRKTSRLTALTAVLLAASLWSGAGFASDKQTARLRGDAAQTPTYALEGGRFIKGAPASSVTLSPELNVLEISQRGYVRVDAKPAPVWLDKLDLKMAPTKGLKARCLQVTSAADTTSRTPVAARPPPRAQGSSARS